MLSNFYDLLKDEIDLQFLREQWSNLLNNYNVTKVDQEEVLNSVMKKYTSRGRVYHNLKHIESLLRLIELFKGKIENNEAVCLAIWFHDVIYNTKAKDNEERSAQLAVKTLNNFGVSEQTIELVRVFILATKEHKGEGLTKDGKLFLDADLFILGTPEDIYKEYSKAIRKEYGWVPSFLYKRGRKKLLENFIKRDRIYFTDEMFEMFEIKARQNIVEELVSLTK